jgi:hypothetical protein
MGTLKPLLSPVLRKDGEVPKGQQVPGEGYHFRSDEKELDKVPRREGDGVNGQR